MNINDDDNILDLESDILKQDEGSEQTLEKDPTAVLLYDILTEKGWVEKSEEFDGTFDFIDEQLSNLPSRLLRDTLDELDPNKRKLMEFIITDPDASIDELRDFYKAYLQEQEKIDVESLDSARTYLEQELALKGLKQKAIQVQLDELEEEGKLIEEAKKVLAEKEQQTNKILLSKKELASKKEEDKKIFISAVQKHLMETNWKQERLNKVKNTLPKVKNIVNEILNSPEALVQFADLLTYFDGKSFKLDVFQKQAESRVNSNLKSIIEKNGFNQTTTGAKGSSDIEDLFKKFKAVV